MKFENLKIAINEINEKLLKDLDKLIPYNILQEKIRSYKYIWKITDIDFKDYDTRHWVKNVSYKYIKLEDHLKLFNEYLRIKDEIIIKKLGDNNDYIIRMEQIQYYAEKRRKDFLEKEKKREERNARQREYYYIKKMDDMLNEDHLDGPPELEYL
jgi:hypothetical protein